MLERADQYELDVIVVKSAMDLASNVRDLVHIFGRMYFADCYIMFLEEGIDSTQVDDSLFEELYRTLIPEATDRYPLPSGI